MEKQTTERAVRELWEQGHTYIDVPQKSVETVAGGFKQFIGWRRQLDDAAHWGLQRAGEDEVDRGLWTRDGNGKDIKSVFHYDPLLHDDLAASGAKFSSADQHFFAAASALYHQLALQAALLLAVCDAQYGTHMQLPFLCSGNGTPYATTTLRNLWYPAVADQRGAKPHLDRGLLTIHLGDEGGHLLALAGKDDPDGVPISPKPGKALVFWGVKVLWATEGRIEPLWHSSVTEPGKERFALVQFNHIALAEYEVRDAETAEQYYWSDVHEKK